MQFHLLAEQSITSLVESDYFWVNNLDDHLLVLDRGHAELHLLNPAASLLFLLLDEGVSDIQALVATYQAYIGKNTHQALAGVKETVDHWISLQWLIDSSSGLCLRRELADLPTIFSGRAEILPSDTVLPLPSHCEDICIQLQSPHSCHILFESSEVNRYPDAIPRLKGLLSGLASTKEPSIKLKFIIDGSQIYVQTPEYLLRTTDESFGLASLATGILRHSYRDRNIFATMHAAALTYNNCSLVLPGVSGSGKSTLTAYLAAKGWQYLGDDVIALGSRPDEEGIEVLSFCTAVGLKPGSWPFMQSWYPELMSLPIVSYSDRQARFVTVANAANDTDKAPVKALVFPRYQASAEKLVIRSLSNSEAMNAIIHAGLTVGLTPNSANLREVIDLVRNTSCYQLEYSDLASAERCLSELCHDQ